MAAKLTKLAHRIAIQLHLAAEKFTICSSGSRRSVRRLLDTPSYITIRIRKLKQKYIFHKSWFGHSYSLPVRGLALWLLGRSCFCVITLMSQLYSMGVPCVVTFLFRRTHTLPLPSVFHLSETLQSVSSSMILRFYNDDTNIDRRSRYPSRWPRGLRYFPIL